MRPARTALVLLGVGLVAGAGWWWAGGPGAADANLAALPTTTATDAGASRREAAGTGEPDATPASGAEMPSLAAFNEAGFVEGMRERFGPHMHRPHAQVRSLEQLIAYLQQQYPDDWESRVLPMLERLWPDQAAALYARYNALRGYQDWLRAERDSLRALPAGERRERLWAARHQAFGADAEQIWAAERRSQALGEALTELPAQAPPAQRAAAYRAAIESIYGEQAPRLLAQRRTELLNSFVATADVQRDLRALPPAQRADTLRAIRAELGMPEDAQQRWSELDARRDARWARGQDYMARREALLQAEGPQALDGLRQEIFGEQAAVIAREEEAGFFRYAGERRIGRE